MYKQIDEIYNNFIDNFINDNFINNNFINNDTIPPYYIINVTEKSLNFDKDKTSYTNIIEYLNHEYEFMNTLCQGIDGNNCNAPRPFRNK